MLSPIHLSLGPLLANTQPPAGGAPLEDVVAASIVAAVGIVLLLWVAIGYRRGGASPLGRLVTFASRVSGLPPWAALPAAVVAGSLIVAVFGFYWDVSTHIDNGRDPGPFANPSHYFILAGLSGIAVAGYLSVVVGTTHPTRTSIRLTDGWHAPLGGALILLCGSIALLGFPLDDVWHRLFGQDVTLWGPTHVQMIGGAALTTVGLWLLLREAQPTGSRGLAPWLASGVHQVFLAGAVLMGLSALQAEFDFGVPQFQLVFHPILIMLAAGIALPAARIILGPGGALKAAAFFIVLRGALALIIHVGLGRSLLHFPLYLVEAALVEVVARRVPTGRQVTFGVTSGVAIGTVGLAAEWGWSHLWMPIPWPAGLLPEGVVLGFAAAVAGGFLGGLVGRALSPPGAPRQRVRGWMTAAAALVAVAAIALPLRHGDRPPISAQVALSEAVSQDGRWVHATVRIEPEDAVAGAKWFHALAWQGLEWRRGSSVLSELEPVRAGVYRTADPVPVHGNWKTLIRLHGDDWIVALPVYLPDDPAIPAPEVPAEASFERRFVPDKQLLQREALGGSPGLWAAASLILLAIAAVWIWALAWALVRFDRAARSSPTSAPDGADRRRSVTLNDRSKRPERARRR
jgi:hypothetical protein